MALERNGPQETHDLDSDKCMPGTVQLGSQPTEAWRPLPPSSSKGAWMPLNQQTILKKRSTNA